MAVAAACVGRHAVAAISSAVECEPIRSLPYKSGRANCIHSTVAEAVVAVAAAVAADGQ